jgi:hypothetical protein
MEINQYAVTASEMKDLSFLDIDQYVSAGVYQSQKVPVSLVKAYMLSENIEQILLADMQALAVAGDLVSLKNYLIDDGSTLYLVMAAGGVGNQIYQYAIDVTSGLFGTFDLVSGVFTVAAPTIQQVLDAGDTSTTPIIIDDGAGNSVTIGPDLIKFFNTIGGTAQIKASALANNVIFEIPNKAAGTQTFAMLSDVSTPNIQQVLDEGNTSTTAIKIDNGTGNYVQVNSSNILMEDSSGNALSVYPDSMTIQNPSFGAGTIKATALANNVTFELPNKAAGTQTFAMLSDISGGGGDVYLANDQTFTGENTFAIPSGSKEPIIVTKGGSGAAIKVTKSSGSGDAIEVADGSVSIADETASTIAHFDGSKRIKSLATATYPSLTELSYVKGATSAIQTQINGKMTNPMTTGGDIIYGGSSGAPTRLANGTAGQILQSNGTTLAPSWVAAPSGTNTYSVNVQSFSLLAPVDATSYHFGIIGDIMATTTLRREFKFPQAGTMTAFSFNLLQATNGSSETCTLYLRNTTTSTDYTIGTFTSDFGLNGALKTLYSGLTIAVNTTDNWVVKILTPTWGTNPANWGTNGLILITT